MDGKEVFEMRIRKDNFETVSNLLDALEVNQVCLFQIEPRKLLHVEYTDCVTLAVSYMKSLANRGDVTLKNVIAVKHNGQWLQAMITHEVVEGLIKHDKHFTNALWITENGTLATFKEIELPGDKQPSLPYSPEEQQSTPQ